MTFLVDTNVWSELRKPAPHPAVPEWIAGADAERLHLSVITIGEIRHGIARQQRRGEARRAERLDSWLRETLADFGRRILPVDVAVAEEWGRLRVIRPLQLADALIAATAVVHNLTIATRNVDDFAGTGVPVFNPFDGKSNHDGALS